MTRLPTGFSAHVCNVGIKDSTDDLVIVVADTPVASSAVFTRSTFAGASVLISRQHATRAVARAMVIISKNSNVATGAQGAANAREVVEDVARHLGCPPEEVLIASTGVIGRQYPMDRLRAGLASLPATFSNTDATAVARAMMTTDTVAKVASADVAGSAARIVGTAKGVGMIEPKMATHISLVMTDARIDSRDLDTIFRRVVDRTLNRVSVDGDTSTSDTSVCMASGAAGDVDLAAFEAALDDVMLSLTKQIARDGEGATKLIEVRVDHAGSDHQAEVVARSIVNSPLVKTAVHGADPNWGRVAMAIGKCSEFVDVDQERVIIRFGTQEVYPRQVDENGLSELSRYMRGTDVLIHVTLNTGDATTTMWGCDLSDGYVRINADYTT
ncbi:MAG: bifunctional glutamate N-acetyltransferase/amino-acid acetyltransferase ArgJ [Ilumatobacteraceae bacterium]